MCLCKYSQNDKFWLYQYHFPVGFSKKLELGWQRQNQSHTLKMTHLKVTLRLHEGRADSAFWHWISFCKWPLICDFVSMDEEAALPLPPFLSCSLPHCSHAGVWGPPPAFSPWLQGSTDVAHIALTHILWQTDAEMDLASATVLGMAASCEEELTTGSYSDWCWQRTFLLRSKCLENQMFLGFGLSTANKA